MASARNSWARPSRPGTGRWWYPHADLIDEAFETHLILEDDAAVQCTYQPNLVPGLLQTERYAWELIGTRRTFRSRRCTRRHACA